LFFFHLKEYLQSVFNYQSTEKKLRVKFLKNLGWSLNR
jgi:hypothetical protein